MIFVLLLLPLLCLWGRVLAPGVSQLVDKIGSPPSLPSYHVRLSDGQSVHGTADPAEGDAVLKLDRDAILEILVQPDEIVEGDTRVDAFLVRGGRTVPWSIGLERATSGAFKLRAPVRALPQLTTGRWDVLLRVRRPRALFDELVVSSLSPLTNRNSVRLLWGRMDIANRSM